MANLNALKVAVDAATRQRDDVRRLLQQARRSREAAQGQLTQIESYAAEIQARWGVQEGALIPPERLFHHYQFLGRLEHAAGLQQTVLSDQDQRVAQIVQVLLKAELRLTSLRKVLERRAQEYVQQQMRRDQKQTDESAALKYRHTHTADQAQES